MLINVTVTTCPLVSSVFNENDPDLRCGVGLRFGDTLQGRIKLDANHVLLSGGIWAKDANTKASRRQQNTLRAADQTENPAP